MLLGALWRRPLLTKGQDGRELASGFSRVVLGPVRIVVQAVSVVLFVMVWVSALLGDTDPFRNLAPTFGNSFGAQLLDVYVRDPSASQFSTDSAFPGERPTLSDWANHL